MPFIEKLQEIENLQNTIEQHGKIAADVLRKINYKFRLDWNYYSNVIEGNSLTMQETRSIMIGNITVDGKPIKDVMEMKGHDDVISDILKIGKSELNLSEKRIKDIHRGIMHEEDVAKQPFIGQWKKEPNYLYNYKKERFDFTAPADVPDEMHKLINRLNTEKEKIARKAKDALHPIQLAFHFHIDYVTIHPFYDGNGRTARIFTNLILISYGYPPVYVKDTEKEVYNQYLGEIQTYGGDTELFYDFMAGLLVRSQQLVVDALEGKNIDEANDWQKKLLFLKFERNNDDLKLTKNNEILQHTIEQIIVPFIKNLTNNLSQVDDLFSSKKMSLSSSFFEIKKHIVTRNFENISTIDSTLKYFKDGRIRGYSPLFTYDENTDFYTIDNLTFNTIWDGFERDGTNTFDILMSIKWKFGAYKYSFFINSKHVNSTIDKLYNSAYSNEEILELTNLIGNQLYHEIEIQLRP